MNRALSILAAIVVLAAIVPSVLAGASESAPPAASYEPSFEPDPSYDPEPDPSSEPTTPPPPIAIDGCTVTLAQEAGIWVDLYGPASDPETYIATGGVVTIDTASLPAGHYVAVWDDRVTVIDFDPPCSEPVHVEAFVADPPTGGLVPALTPPPTDTEAG